MITFEVNDMTCGHCVSTITKALKSADKDAKVTIDFDDDSVGRKKLVIAFASLTRGFD